MDGVNVQQPREKPVLCGKCNVHLDRHPVEQCPYTYEPIYFNDRVVGYHLMPKQ
jgi:hypothetical protein